MQLLLAAGRSSGPNSNDTSTKQSAAKARPASEDSCAFCGGDIADDLADAPATADLLDKISGTMFAVGDLVYPEGADE